LSVSFFSGQDKIASVVVTDSARPLTNATHPNFTAACTVTTIVPTPADSRLSRRIDHSTSDWSARSLRQPDLRRGRDRPYQTVRLVPVGDHAVLVTQLLIALIGSHLDECELDRRRVPTPQKLVKLASQFTPFTVEGHRLAVTTLQHVALFNLNADVT
jgi:hypothetical protein